MKAIEFAKKQLDRFYLDNIELRKIHPSYHFIENYSEVLLDVIAEVKKENNVMDTTLHYLWKDADIFQADLVGELLHDYEKRNKRYRDKWLTEKKKIDDITLELFEHLSEKNDTSIEM